MLSYTWLDKQLPSRLDFYEVGFISLAHAGLVCTQKNDIKSIRKRQN